MLSCFKSCSSSIRRPLQDERKREIYLSFLNSLFGLFCFYYLFYLLLEDLCGMRGGESSRANRAAWLDHCVTTARLRVQLLGCFWSVQCCPQVFWWISLFHEFCHITATTTTTTTTGIQFLVFESQTSDEHVNQKSKNDNKNNDIYNNSNHKQQKQQKQQQPKTTTATMTKQ